MLCYFVECYCLKTAVSFTTMPSSLQFCNSFHLSLCLTYFHLSLSSLSHVSPSFIVAYHLSSLCLELPAPVWLPPATFSPSCLVPTPYPAPPSSPSPKPQPLHDGQLRLSSLMRVDGAVWAVELTTFTGQNENDPSSLAGLSPHWPNFIMANYYGRPLVLCCCCCCWGGPAPIYMDT